MKQVFAIKNAENDFMVSRKILNMFEIILSGILVAAFITRSINYDILPYIFEIISTVIIGYILVTVLEIHKNPYHKLQLSISILITVLAVFAVHASYNSESETKIPLLYLLVVSSISLLGGKRLWILSYILIFFAETGYNFFLQYNSNQSELVVNFLILAKNLIIPGTILLFAGLVPSVIVDKKRIEMDVSKQSTLQREHKIESAPETDFFYEQDQTLVPTKTQMFSVNYISEFKQKHEENIQELLYSVVYFMSRNFKAYSALGFIYNPSNKTFVLNSFQSRSQCIVKGVVIGIGEGIVGRIGTEKRSFMSGDFSFYNSVLQYYTEPQGINSIIAVPIISDKKELLGTLVLDSLDKKAFRDQDKELLKRFSSLAAALITNARMRLYQEQSARMFQIFYQASHKFTTALKYDDVFDVLFEVVQLAVTCTRQIAIVFNDKKKRGLIYKIAGESTDIQEGLEFPINSGLYSFVFQKRKMINIDDFFQYQTKYYRFFPDEPKNAKTRSLIIFPILDDESRCRGLFSIESDKINQFGNDTVQILATLIENASVAFTRAILYSQMERLATTDGLTGLNNHRHFQEILAKEIERGKRYRHSVSLLLMDIDKFKTFNDTYGHPVGDLVLKEIATCIRGAIRVNDIPARYGGEEFTVIIPETDEHGAMVIAERIRSNIEKHVIHSLDKELHVTVSIGCATWPLMVSTQQELIDRADQALYFSKKHGRNRITMFNPDASEKR